MTYCFGQRYYGLKSENLLNFFWGSIFFNILVANISWTVAQTSYKPVYWELSDACMENTLTDLGFLLRSAQNCKKSTFLDNLATITQEGNTETRQMTPISLSTFSALFVTFIFVFENSQNSFSFGPPVIHFDM